MRFNLNELTMRFRHYSVGWGAWRFGLVLLPDDYFFVGFFKVLR
jgi:hypothetical protein